MSYFRFQGMLIDLKLTHWLKVVGWAREGQVTWEVWERNAPLCRPLLCAWRERGKQSGSSSPRAEEGGREGEGLRAGLRADGHWRAPEHRQSPPAALGLALRAGKGAGARAGEIPGTCPERRGWVPGASTPAQTASPHRGPRGLPSAPDADTSSLVGWRSGWTAWEEVCGVTALCFPRGGARPRNTGLDFWACSF